MHWEPGSVLLEHRLARIATMGNILVEAYLWNRSLFLSLTCILWCFCFELSVWLEVPLEPVLGEGLSSTCNTLGLKIRQIGSLKNWNQNGTCLVFTQDDFKYNWQKMHNTRGENHSTRAGDTNLAIFVTDMVTIEIEECLRKCAKRK